MVTRPARGTLLVGGGGAPAGACGAPAGACGPPDALSGRFKTGPCGAGESSTPTQTSHGDNRAGAWSQHRARARFNATRWRWASAATPSKPPRGASAGARSSTIEQGVSRTAVARSTAQRQQRQRARPRQWARPAQRARQPDRAPDRHRARARPAGATQPTGALRSAGSRRGSRLLGGNRWLHWPGHGDGLVVHRPDGVRAAAGLELRAARLRAANGCLRPHRDH